MRKIVQFANWVCYWMTPDILLYRVFSRIPKKNPNKFLEDQRRRAANKRPALFNVEYFWFKP